VRVLDVNQQVGQIVVEAHRSEEQFVRAFGHGPEVFLLRAVGCLCSIDRIVRDEAKVNNLGGCPLHQAGYLAAILIRVGERYIPQANHAGFMR